MGIHIDTNGAWVRISKQQQAEIDAEMERITPKRSVVMKRQRKRKIDFLRSDGEVEVEHAIPQSMRLSAIMMQRWMSNHDGEAIANWSMNEASTRLEHLEEMWREFNVGWQALTLRSISSANLNTCSDFYGEITDEYLRFKSMLRDRFGHVSSLPNSGIAHKQSSTAVTAGGQMIQIQLAEAPKVPKFSGLEVDWANFRAIFEVEVHLNMGISNTQKMHLLLNSLEGRAAKAYANWPIINDNSYGLLWAEICNHYGNEYNTIRAHLQALQTLKPMQHPTSDAMRQMVDVARGSFRQLQLLLKPEQIAEYMVLHQLESLLDAEGRAQWNLRRTMEALPTLSQMFNFMQLRASMLDTLAVAPGTQITTTNNGFRSKVPANNTSIATQRGQSIGRGDEPHPACDLCAGQTHWPFKCPQFREKSIAERTNYVITHRMCTNCFSFKHFSKNCPDKGCPRCNKKHNSCLCPLNARIVGQNQKESGREAVASRRTQQ